MQRISASGNAVGTQSLKQQGIALFEDNRLEEAKLLFEEFCHANANDAEAWYFLSTIHGLTGNLKEAANCCHLAIALQPDNSLVHSNLGNIFHLQGHLDNAVKEYRRALRIDPGNAAAHCNLANSLSSLGKIDEAIAHYEEAIRLNGNLHEAHANLGNILFYHRHKPNDALACYQQALHLKPDFVPALNGSGNIYGLQGKHDEARASYQEALKHDPYNAIARSNLLFSLCYRADCDAETLFAEHVRWGGIHEHDPASIPDYTNVPDKNKRLRIGYVSADFRNHPVGIFLEQVLACHDNSNVEIFCYSNHGLKDDLTARLRRCANHWRDIVALPDEAVAQLIRQDGIDILVDLSGHTAGNRLSTFAFKPAPVQATWMSYVATTGLNAIDYIIANRFVIPPEDERYYVERVVRLPHHFLCFTPPRPSVAVSALPAESKGNITFGCFNNAAKLTREVIAAWSQLLLSVPGSRLFLKSSGFNDEATRTHFQNLFAEHGVPSMRLQFAGRSPRNEYLAAYHAVDIALDPFPYNGGTTTVEALWMGVPVVTLRGDRFVARMGESIMTNVGLEECVTATKDAYIAKAVALGSDLPRLAELRRGLRSQLLNSPLCDGPGFTSELESAYRRMWQTWCDASQESDVQKDPTVSQELATGQKDVGLAWTETSTRREPR